MGIFDKLLNAVDELNVHTTDTWQICPHCNQKVHISKCRMPKLNRNDAKHYESLEGVSKQVVKGAMKANGANGLLAKGFADMVAPKAQRGIEETAYIMRNNVNNLKKREATCPKCGKTIIYSVDSFVKW